MKFFIKRKSKADKMIEQLQKENPHKRLGDILIRQGRSDKMEIITGSVTEATTAGMKIRQGYNNNEEMFFFQLHDKNTKESFRIYLTPEEYQIVIRHGQFTLNASLRDTGK